MSIPLLLRLKATPMYRISRLTHTLFFLVSVCITGSIAGNEVNKDVAEFTKISMSVSGTVDLVQSDEHRVALKLVRGELDDLEVAVKRGTLVLRLDCGFGKRCTRPYPKIEGRIYYKTINRLNMNGSGRMTAKDMKTPGLDAAINGAGEFEFGALQSEKFHLKINGAGDVSVEEGEFDEFSATINGAGNIDIEKGSTTTSEVKLVGSGDFSGIGLTSSKTEVKVVGAGKARVHATDSLDVAITGSGDVVYDGSPKISSRVSGSGKIASL